ncbi:MAG: sulfite exporter TauE/SafE family protein [Acidimicrobiia bacterium]|nr:sulfite exporter TauE/SafE family protein [Acidimicrobiia bacterium]NNC74434.1 sulfite exporter TauE/SafE family protein [Acidimicrobiia bacterium]
MPVEPWALVVAVVVTMVASSIQGIIGIGFALISIPTLSLVDPALTPVPQLLVTAPMTMWMAWQERRHIDLSGVGWIMAGRVAGAVIGLTLLKVSTDAAIDVLMASAVLVAVAILGLGIKVAQNRVTKAAAGTLSGTMALVASMAGPPLALLYKDERGPVIRATLATIFTMGVAITLVTRIVGGEITTDDVKIGAMIFPGLVAGLAIARVSRYRFEGAAIRVGILVLSTIGAIGLILRAVS